MSSQLPREDKSQEIWDIKLGINGDICQEKQIGTGLARFNNAMLCLDSDSYQEILWFMLSVMYYYVDLLH